jgi:tripartite-type tricarboxylate transporter receptor subunit TctC
MRKIVAWSYLSLAALVPVTAWSVYPEKPIRLVVPYIAGGTTDVMARAVAQKMSEGLGQLVVVDNRPGASTIIGAEAVAKAAPDGYTLFFATGTSLNLNPLLFSKLPYDPEKDFIPVGKVAVMPFVLLVHPSMPNSFEDFIAYAKSNPGKLNLGTPGKNTSPHLAGLLLEQSFGLNLESIHYKGAAPVAIDLLAGRIQLYFDALLTPLPQIKSGKVKALAAASLKRLPALPDVPTIAEYYPGFDVAVWFCIVAPTGTPQEIVNRLNAEIQKYVNGAGNEERMLAQGVILEGGTPEQLGSYIREETQRWTAVIRKAGLKPE